MKQLLFLLTFMCLCTWGYAQSEDDDELVNLDTIYPENVMQPADTCISPVVTDVTVLQFETYAEAQVTIFPSNLASTIYYKELGSTSEFSQVQASETGVAMFYGLGKSKTYQIAVQNHCGVLTSIGIINTQTEFEGTVTVSEKLHFELNRYLKEESTVKLTDFLRNLIAVSLFERTSFVQRFFFNGTPLTDGAPLIIPEITVPTVCFCKEIFTTQLAIPAQLQFITPGSGNIENYTQPGSGVKTNLGGNSNGWYWLNNRGAAKYHEVWTEGWKADKSSNKSYQVSWDGPAIPIAAQKSYIKVTLLCLDGDEVPAECGCEKDIEFSYRYDVRATTFAKITGTTNSREAWAQAEDFFTVVFEDESKPDDTRYQVLDMDVTRAASQCSFTVNPQFWTNITTLLGQSANLYFAYTATQNIPEGQNPNPAQQNALTTAITNFANTLGAVFTTSYGLPTDCDIYDDKFGGKERSSVVRSFKPNATITLTVSSYDKIACGGKRKWFSNARVLSGHYLTGVVKHNAYDGTPLHCCTPKIGMWLVGHCGGSRTEDQLKVEAADNLYHNGILGLIQTPGGRSVENDFGYTVQASSLEICNTIVVNPEVTGGRSDGSETASILDDFTTIQIYDATGRLVNSMQWSVGFSKTDLTTLSNANSDLPPGIYFALVYGKNGRDSFKFYNH
jgi:hypothetical protein